VLTAAVEIPDLSPTVASSYAFQQELLPMSMEEKSGNSNHQAI
jgi:hypothetical protein